MIGINVTTHVGSVMGISLAYMRVQGIQTTTWASHFGE